jgi:signal transduction histidine kinase
MSRSAASLTRNLVWVATRGGHALDRPEPEYLTPLLIACAIDVQGTAAYKGIRVHVEEALTDRLPRIPIDKKRITQVIVNLLDNAVKYADRNTEVRITGREADGSVFIQISNYGIPLDGRYVEKVFDRGFRTQEARQKAPGGTGIGLPVSRDIARLHGGDLFVEPSVYDPGIRKHRVTFTLRLKITSSESAA